MRSSLFLVAIALAACTGAADKDTDTPDETDSDATVDTDVDTPDDTDVDTPDDSDTDTQDDTDVVDTDPDLDPVADDDGDGEPNATDCRPLDPNSFPGAPELCDGVDNDCEPMTTDEGTATWVDAGGTLPPVDLSAELEVGAMVDTATGFGTNIRQLGAGTLNLCGGTWSGILGTVSGAALDVVGSAAWSVPVIEDASVTLDGGGSLRNVAVTSSFVYQNRGAFALVDATLTDTRVSLRAGTTLLVEDDTLVRSTIGVGPGMSTQIRDTTVDGTLGFSPVFYALNDPAPGQPNPPRPLVVEDVTANDATLLSANFAATIRRVTTTGTAALGGVFSLDLDTWTSEAGGLGVTGDGSPAATATLTNIQVTLPNAVVQLQGLSSATVTASTISAPGADAFRGLQVVDVASLTVSDTSFVGFSPVGLRNSNLASSTASFTDVSLDAGVSSGTGGRGRLMTAEGGVNLTLLRATFDGGESTGCLRLMGPSAQVTDSSFTACHTTGTSNTTSHGGAVLAFPSTSGSYTFTNTAFTGNTSSQHGSALAAFDSDVALDGCVVAGNTAPLGLSTYQGAIYVGTSASATLTDTTVDGNNGQASAAMRVDGGVTMTGGAILNHTAVTTGGGAVELASAGTFTFTNVDLGTGMNDNAPHDIRAGGAGSFSYDGPLATTQVCTTTTGCGPVP